MKKLIALIAIVLSLAILCTGCLRKTAKGKNVKVDYTGTSSVGFYPVCPECKHISPMQYANVSDGEQKQGSHMCENCYEVYIITIDRR